jgi:hypothetical protein
MALISILRVENEELSQPISATSSGEEIENKKIKREED